MEATAATPQNKGKLHKTESCGEPVFMANFNFQFKKLKLWYVMLKEQI